MENEKRSMKRFRHVLYPFISRIKNGIYQSKHFISNFAPFLGQNSKTPIIKDNTFIVWEPCSKSHSEVVPGYAKYLLDLGYHVSVIVDKQHIKGGLFCRFQHPNLSFNKLTTDEIKTFFAESDLKNVKGVLVTTIGKICNSETPEEAYKFFNPNVDRNKLFFVEHEACFAVNNGTWKEDLITLRELDYQNTKSVVINPHYFGEIKVTQKNEITNFITVGTLKASKKDCGIIINAVQKLHEKGITNFKVTVVGKGSLKHLPKTIRKHFDIKGRLPFNKMYEEIEKSDFMLTAYDDKNPEHQRYITTGTSGNFQLVYGFLKPCILVESFAPINKFNEENSILYKESDNYAEALEQAIKMNNKEYQKMQDCLSKTVDTIYNESLNNLKGALNG